MNKSDERRRERPGGGSCSEFWVLGSELSSRAGSQRKQRNQRDQMNKSDERRRERRDGGCCSEFWVLGSEL